MERRAFYEKMWDSPGFQKLTSTCTDLLTDPRPTPNWCDLMAEKIRTDVVANDYRAYSLVRPSCRDSSAAYSARDQATSPLSSYAWRRWPSPVRTAAAAAA
jgi:hypothetical protein